MASLANGARASDGPVRPADVCVIVEGCYPYVPGGVSSWVDWLIRSQPDLEFEVVAILPGPPTSKPIYSPPDNLRCVHHVYLFNDEPARPPRQRKGVLRAESFADSLSALFDSPSQQSLAQLILDLQHALQKYRSCAAFLNSKLAWNAVRIMYERSMPHAAFSDYYWSWRTIVTSIHAVLNCPVPPARVYHTLSTGYAGLLAARIGTEAGSPYLLTEHGIYTNERRIEVLMAPWLNGVLRHGLCPEDDRLDIRDFWTSAFEAIGLLCYQNAVSIVTLYRASQDMQRAAGADRHRQLIIPNGIDPSPYASIAQRPDRPPTIAFIGRIAPIKDVKTFIEAAGYVRRSWPDLRAYLIGPADEDPDYARECYALAESAGLSDTIRFTGMVDIKEYLGEIDIVVLTSLSEAQPLIVLEAGAAGIPCVTTDVGSCRDLIEGVAGESPPLGPGGIVADLVAPRMIADAIETLLSDPHKRRSYGQALRNRVCTYYRSDEVARKYRDLYDRHLVEADQAA